MFQNFTLSLWHFAPLPLTRILAKFEHNSRGEKKSVLSCVHAGRKCKNFPEEGRYSLPLSTAVSPNAILRAISPFVSVNFRAGSSQKPFAVHNRERAEESHDVGGKDFRSRDSGHVCSRQIFLWVPWERGPNERRTLCCAVESSWKVRRAREKYFELSLQTFLQNSR